MEDNKELIEEKKEQKKNKNKKKVPEVKIKSAMYNTDNEKLEKREEEASDAVMWGFVLGFLLFFILLICIIIFTL